MPKRPKCYLCGGPAVLIPDSDRRVYLCVECSLKEHDRVQANKELRPFIGHRPVTHRPRSYFLGGKLV